MKNHIKTFIFLLIVGFIFNIHDIYAAEIKDASYAIVGDKVIFGSDIQKRAELKNISFNDALNEIIEEDILICQAEKEKIDVTENEVSQRLNEIETKLPSSTNFLQFLKESGFSDINEFKTYLKNQIKVEKLIQKNVISNIKFSPVEISEETSKMKFGQSVLLRKILFDREKDANAFNKNFGDDSLKEKEMGKMENIDWVNTGDLSPEMAKLLENPKKGNLYGPILISGKYTIFYIEDIKENDIKTNYMQAREELFHKKYIENLNQYIENLKKTIVIKILYSVNDGNSE